MTGIRFNLFKEISKEFRELRIIRRIMVVTGIINLTLCFTFTLVG